MMSTAPDKKPCNWCRDEYKCPVATVESPDEYFSWIFWVHTLTIGGFKIENRQLSLSEWEDLGILKSLLEAKRQQDNLTQVSHEMLSMVIEAQRRR